MYYTVKDWGNGHVIEIIYFRFLHKHFEVRRALYKHVAYNKLQPVLRIHSVFLVPGRNSFECLAHLVNG